MHVVHQEHVKLETHLGHGPVRLEVARRRDPEHGEAVERQRDREVVRDRDVGVARVLGERAVLVRARRLHDDGGEGEERLDLDVLCGRSIEVSIDCDKLQSMRTRRDARRMPRLRPRKVNGSLASIGWRKRLTGQG